MNVDGPKRGFLVTCPGQGNHMQIKRDIGELDEMGGILLHFCLSLRKYSLQINRS